MWRVWIEILIGLYDKGYFLSPSVWRVWIEIVTAPGRIVTVQVTLRVEGVD